ncbi:hypothetical protein, partial [Salmonella enterica]|uniref:hypothetical protein n=1 Tax=Salmonella enterica TaxID=28901 RepID=UPI003075E860
MYLVLVAVGSIIASLVCSYLLQNLTLAHGILVVAGLCILGCYVRAAVSMSGMARARRLEDGGQRTEEGKKGHQLL